MGWYFIEAEDVLFFRDTRLFGQGEEHFANSVFPPFPTTIAGAIRSRIIADYIGWDQNSFNDGNDPNLYNKIGKPGDLGPGFQIINILLARKINNQFECCIPMPLDVYVNDPDDDPDDDPITFQAFRPYETPDFSANWPQDGLNPLWPPGGQRKEAVEGNFWLNPTNYFFYQSGSPFTAIPQSEFIQRDPRVGIAKDTTTGAAKSSMLYSINFIQTQSNVGLLIEIADSIGLPDQGMLAFGGEGRSAKFLKVAVERLSLPQKCETKGKTRIKAVLLTPAFFKEGWKPIGGDWTRVGLPKNSNLRAASLGRPLLANGWDIARGQAKPLHHCVPAGSVYYFEFDEPLAEEFDPLKVSFTESLEEDFSKLGFGRVILSPWDWES